MEVPEAIAIIKEYWPDPKQIIWGEALETICNKALEVSSSPGIQKSQLAISLMDKLFKEYGELPAYSVPYHLHEAFDEWRRTIQ
jgi:hypothetical protein